MTLEEELNNNNINDIIDGMTAYAYSRLNTMGVKDLEGKTPEEFVGEVLMKVAEGDRDWQKAKCTFKEFLFGSLKSHISNYLVSFKQKFESEILDIEGEVESINVDDLNHISIQILKHEGADQEEIDMFECWIDGINKPSEIADHLGKEIKTIYNIQKRLERKMPKLRTQLNNYI